MRYPRFLSDGAVLGFPAPSFGCSIEPYRSAFDRAQKVLRERGYGTVCGPNAYADDGTGISSSPERCGREITEMLLSKDTDALISCGGGELMCEILPHTDFGSIAAAEPKWFMGYSDNTNLVFLLTTLCDTAAVYGPCAASFGMEPWHKSLEDALMLLRGEKLETEGYPLYETQPDKDAEHPYEPYACTEPRRIRAWRAGEGILEQGGGKKVSFSGRLVGGCLDILATLCGTEYDRVKDFSEKYRDDGLIWFIEACDLTVFGIRRALWQLKNAGWFRTARGFLIGRPWAAQQDVMGLDHIRAVTEALEDLKLPILLDTDIGHLPPMMPLISGSMADVQYDVDADRFHLTMRPE